MDSSRKKIKCFSQDIVEPFGVSSTVKQLASKATVKIDEVRLSVFTLYSGLAFNDYCSVICRAGLEKPNAQIVT